MGAFVYYSICLFRNVHSQTTHTWILFARHSAIVHKSYYTYDLKCFHLIVVVIAYPVIYIWYSMHVLIYFKIQHIYYYVLEFLFGQSRKNPAILPESREMGRIYGPLIRIDGIEHIYKLLCMLSVYAKSQNVYVLKLSRNALT